MGRERSEEIIDLIRGPPSSSNVMILETAAEGEECTGVVGSGSIVRTEDGLCGWT